MDKIGQYNVVHRLQKRSLLVAINCVAALSIFFFGYDQGMMGGVNNAPHYINTMKIGYVTTINGSKNTPVITDSLLQGGIVSVYYLGTLVGALLGGLVAEKYGRIKTVAFGAAWAVFGAALQCTAQNHNWMICARLINGVGTGQLNAVVPVWATETAEHTSRGQFIAIEFTLNIFGVVVAYWLEYGLSFIDGGLSPWRWRFPVAFQILPLLILLGSVFFFPESPRWLVKQGRHEEARYILGRLRGNTEESDIVRAEAEFKEIQGVAELELSNAMPTNYWSMLVGSGNNDLHIARRVQLVIWLQILQEWVGIAGVTIYAPTIFRLAGFSTEKSQWFSGVNNIIYMFATLICVFTLDRIGRRMTLFWGSIVQGIVLFLAGGFSRLGLNATESGNTSAAGSYGIVAASMIVIFTATFGATWLTVPWLYPAEIFPLAVRARGNALGVVGWSIGNGWLTLLLPVCFEKIGEKTYYLFGIANAISIPIVWAFYPESNQRTLEEMDLLFASSSPFTWVAEKNFARYKDERDRLVAGAAERNVDDTPGKVGASKVEDAHFEERV
ncbi:hypothetical protein FFLO_06884 [Filobasidium floriforme]|uniref:Major facilitator superfamily (MFS) profile domain-containing protein n=1 Tax=Filobasidium floriforme TaxID=5210 RepID=A0A8K0JEJ2_9TREE|nr:putative MFS monosaccharide transporter [Filobasidium floriforme]KAG7527487.1 hypothetical protein FFLO_06884 [Filobasidium floriforme]KAH8087098.1 putative MFS monosaccharide transporter [Filobasidium floriforme]